MLRPALACLMLAASLAPAAAEQPLADLLGELAPSAVPRGSVEVLSWIERTGDAPELVVTLVPKGEVKLVADPGVTVTPVQREGLVWRDPDPVSTIEAGQEYFATPPTIRVQFAGEDGKPVEADVEYAYCLVDYQCLFGTAKVSAATTPPSG